MHSCLPLADKNACHRTDSLREPPQICSARGIHDGRETLFVCWALRVGRDLLRDRLLRAMVARWILSMITPLSRPGIAGAISVWGSLGTDGALDATA